MVEPDAVGIAAQDTIGSRLKLNGAGGVGRLAHWQRSRVWAAQSRRVAPESKS